LISVEGEHFRKVPILGFGTRWLEADFLELWTGAEVMEAESQRSWTKDHKIFSVYLM
jgi:hypothetical protein